MQYEYQKYGRYFAPVAGKMEELLAEELRGLGATKVQEGYRGVSFHADKRVLYRINYESRFATRVVAPLLTFNCHSANYLVVTSKKIQWDQFMSLDETFAITASISDSRGFTNSLFAAQCLKDGICDFFREKTGRRPSVDTKSPDLRLNLHIRKNRAVISVDCSGDALHKRGYRKNKVFAPMQETLAAAIIHHTGWTGETKLWDFMCGSGTLLAEAHMKMCNIPAQYLRKKFGFFALPDFDKSIWKEVKEAANSQIIPLPEGLIEGSDKDPKAIESTRENLNQLPGSKAVSLKWRPFQSAGNFENGTIICNPPYGIRLGEREDTEVLYKEMGDFLKHQCNGTAAYLYTGDKTLVKSFGLKPSKRVPLVNGQLDGVLVEIKSFKVKFHDGQRKPKKQVVSMADEMSQEPIFAEEPTQPSIETTVLETSVEKEIHESIAEETHQEIPVVDPTPVVEKIQEEIAEETPVEKEIHESIAEETHQEIPVVDPTPVVEIIQEEIAEPITEKVEEVLDETPAESAEETVQEEKNEEPIVEEKPKLSLSERAKRTKARRKNDSDLPPIQLIDPSELKEKKKKAKRPMGELPPIG